MSDYELYGDYNEIEEPPSKSPLSIIFKVLIFALCIFVIGFFTFRIIIFNSYPESVTNIYFTEELKEHYNKTNGNIGALTQELLNSSNYGYDDSKDGNFFAKHFIYIPATEELQITLRYNTSLMKSIEDNFGITLDPDSENNFTFRLVGVRASDEVEENTPDAEIGQVFDCELKAEVYDKSFMYRFIKLSFDGIDLKEDTEDAVDWLRLEIFVNGAEQKEPYMILIYYNNEKFPLIPYKLSEGEKL